MDKVKQTATSASSKRASKPKPKEKKPTVNLEKFLKNMARVAKQGIHAQGWGAAVRMTQECVETEKPLTKEEASALIKTQIEF